jgi:hypothetical protein
MEPGLIFKNLGIALALGPHADLHFKLLGVLRIQERG